MRCAWFLPVPAPAPLVPQMLNAAWTCTAVGQPVSRDAAQAPRAEAMSAQITRTFSPARMTPPATREATTTAVRITSATTLVPPTLSVLRESTVAVQLAKQVAAVRVTVRMVPCARVMSVPLAVQLTL